MNPTPDANPLFLIAHDGQRSMFPALTRAVPNEVVLGGCMKGIEETGTHGLLFPPGGGLREIRDVKVTIKPGGIS